MRIQFKTFDDAYKALTVFTPHIRNGEILNYKGKVKEGSIYMTRDYAVYVALSPNNRTLKKILKEIKSNGIEFTIL